MMYGCKCLCWNRLPDFLPPEPETFSLPAPLPNWPPGQGFASGRINLGDLEVCKVTRFEFVWSNNLSQEKNKGGTFYKPVGIPDGYHILGHYCQPNNQPLRGYVLVAREVDTFMPETAHASSTTKLPALCEPLDYTLVWSSKDWTEENYGQCGYIWLPQAPEGYKPVGFLVTNKPDKPRLYEVRCVRVDLTDQCDAYRLLLDSSSRYMNFPFQVWSTRPHHRGMMGKGVPVGTFFCSTNCSAEEDLSIACLKNLNPAIPAMPNLDQSHALINHYGPTVFFHPEEIYLPSSVSWFFNSGSLLYRTGVTVGETIDADGSNLPIGGTNDRSFWIDLPCDNRRDSVKRGNLESAKLYVHVKPALGGIFTDIAMWVFCPFNGPATLKVGVMNISLTKIGEHVGDWEHFTLRICNFTGELWSIYFSQHSGGQWVDAYNLEYIEGNKAIVYASKSGHASYPHPGTYIQGSSKLGIGIRNDAARSNFFVDSSSQYELVAAEYLGDGVVTEPSWLQFMREWGPTIVYDSRTELDKIINRLPMMVRYSVGNWCAKFPVELSGQEGPTGPKEKNNWVGDERG
ncbi:Vacuolar protein sorting-associated protein [Parasponia andersonii]|uniref:Vacuolar protein sorting-associated protein n=1 Tax=Parasponia andersonii TaxID=3476 RepID=A0A2P5B6G0_PARAD|nr:Vacuolar protein sorting-associated protein [Parasponia andersonii]